MPKPVAELLIKDASLVITCLSTEGDLIGRVDNATLAVGGGRILALGPMHTLPDLVGLENAFEIDARGKIVAPGFVDCHTHLVFGGTRVQEYAAKITLSLEEIQARGIPTGILSTVAMTRAESADQLTATGLERLDAMLAHGTTTVESKSGYGLNLTEELKMLSVNQRLNTEHPIDVVSTFLGAHAILPDVTHDRYVDEVVDTMIPAVVEGGYAEFCDVYCDDGYFSLEGTRKILKAAQNAGLKLKIHTDQYAHLGGSELAAELRVVSADHLNYTGRQEMRHLAEAGVIGVVMPLIDFAVDHPRPVQARPMLENGLSLALATDFCPGSWSVSMQLAIQFACRINRFSPEEAFFAATVGSARALDLPDRGVLAPGKLADIQIWDLPTFEDLVYRVGNNAVETVIKRGEIVFQRSVSMPASQTNLNRF